MEEEYLEYLLSSSSPSSENITPDVNSSLQKAPTTVLKSVPECPNEEPMITDCTEIDNDEEDYIHLEANSEQSKVDNVKISSDKKDEPQTTTSMGKQSVEDSSHTYTPRYVSREKLKERHPRFGGLTFGSIIDQAVSEDKVHFFHDQMMPQNVADKVRSTGCKVYDKKFEGGCIISSNIKETKMYYSTFSTRLEPKLNDPEKQKHLEQYRKSIDVEMWENQGNKGCPPADDPPESSLPTSGESEEDDEFIQGSVCAWIGPDAKKPS